MRKTHMRPPKVEVGLSEYIALFSNKSIAICKSLIITTVVPNAVSELIGPIHWIKNCFKSVVVKRRESAPYNLLYSEYLRKLRESLRRNSSRFPIMGRGLGPGGSFLLFEDCLTMNLIV